MQLVKTLPRQSINFTLTEKKKKRQRTQGAKTNCPAPVAAPVSGNKSQMKDGLRICKSCLLAQKSSRNIFKWLAERPWHSFVIE